MLKIYNSLIYKIDVFKLWKIHFIISIVILKFIFQEKIFYNKSRKKRLSLIKEMKIDDVYEFKRVINRRMFNKESGFKRRKIM